MREFQKDWKCSKCSTDFINTITVAELPSGKSGKDVLIRCPKCGTNAFLMAGIAEKIVKVKTDPKA